MVGRIAATAAADWIGAAVASGPWRNQEKTEKGGRNRFKIANSWFS